MTGPFEGIYPELVEINKRPEPFSCYTAETLWNDPYISKRMLDFHLDGDIEPASRNRAFMERSFRWMDGRFNIGPGMRICDFGCGPGLYTTQWADAGARVTGVDFSQRSIDYARKMAASRGLDIDYVLENYLDYTTDQSFDLITMIYCDLCPLSPAQRAIMLGKFYDRLGRDGLLFLDVFSLNAYDQREEEAVYERQLLDGFWASGDYYGFLNVFKYEDEKVMLDRYTIVEPSRTRVVYNWLQYYSLDSIQAELADNGFAVKELYADVAGSAYHPAATEIAVVAQKVS